jgi:hypothetical protein
MIVTAVGLASATSLAGAYSLGTMFDPPKAKLIMQNTRTVEWLAVPRATVAQRGTRLIRLRGPWMDYVTSVTASNGVSARNFKTADQQVDMTLDAAETAPRGDFTLRLNITCPKVPFTNVVVGDCQSSATFPVRVFETGPIATIFPNGVVPPNAQVTFDLTGEALNVAVLLPRLLSLKSASILSKTATTMRVRGTTPSCGHIDVALTDQADGDENPYRKASTLQPVLAGTICGTSLAPRVPSVAQCPPGQTFDPVSNVCKP